jgi:ribonuclease HI
MNTQTQEAFQMAIEAIESCNHTISYSGLDEPLISFKALNACKEALASNSEALEMSIQYIHGMVKGDVSYNGVSNNQVINACKEALEQPSWQGLTADELEDIKDNSKEGWYQLVRNVEQALKDKNDN